MGIRALFVCPCQTGCGVHAWQLGSGSAYVCQLMQNGMRMLESRELGSCPGLASLVMTTDAGDETV